MRVPILEAESERDPIAPEGYLAIARAGKKLRPVRRAQRAAWWSGVATLFGGVFTAAIAFGSWTTVSLGVVLAVLGWRELFHRKALLWLDLDAAGRLAWNQVGLGLALCGYAVVQLVQGPPDIGLQDQLAQAGAVLDAGQERAAERAIALGFYGLYGGLILLSVFMQGGTALMYVTAGARLRRLTRESPVWVMRVHRSASGRADAA